MKINLKDIERIEDDEVFVPVIRNKQRPGDAERRHDKNAKPRIRCASKFDLLEKEDD